jgi:hypothetical protein
VVQQQAHRSSQHPPAQPVLLLPLVALQPQQVPQQQLVQALLQAQVLLQQQVVLVAALQTQEEPLRPVQQQQPH